MTNAIRCVDVTKRYQLGQTRTSLLSALSGAVKRNLNPGRYQHTNRETLWALDKVSFELERGRSLGLIGKNGAGKSTMLKLLANITKPTSGTIETNGRLSALIELGSGFHPDLTGRENIFLNGTILGLSRKDIRTRFDEIVAFSELEQFIETPIKRYSSGMLVRLGFAVASFIEPEILLVDEVLAVGDASFRQKCLGRIQTLLDDGTSIIFVSHNINMVQAVCDEAIYLQRGKVSFAGDVKTAIGHYEHDLHVEEMNSFAALKGETVSAPGQEILITDVQVCNDSGQVAPELDGAEAAEIKVDFVATQPLDNLNAVVRIVRSDGITCCRVRSSLDESAMSVPAGPGSFAVRFEPLQLIGGAYFAEAYVTYGDDQIILTNRQSDWFLLRGGPLSSDKNSGIFEPRRRWLLPSGTRRRNDVVDEPG